MTLAPTSVLLVASLLSPHPVSSTSPLAATPASLVVGAPRGGQLVDLGRVLRSTPSDRGARPVALVPPTTQGAKPARQRPVILSLLGVAAGFVGGAFVGGMIGARLEPPCRCDDPGLTGFVWGARIGGVAGAITAGYFLNK